MQRAPHRRATAIAALLIGLAIVVAASVATAYSRAGITVAGSIRSDLNTQGTFPNSRISNPFGMCSNYDATDVTDSTFLIGGSAYFFTFNRYTTNLGFWYGQADPGSSTGPIGTVLLIGVFGCATLPPSSGSSSTISTVYYVQGDNNLYWVTNATTVSMTLVQTNTSFFDVTIYNGAVYLFNSNNTVYQCTINPGGVVIGSDCTKIPLTGSNAYLGLSTSTTATLKGFAVSAAGIFIAPSADLYWFSLSGAFQTSSTGLTFVDTKFTRNTDTANAGAPVLMAATSSAIYGISTAGSLLTYTIVSGTETANCDPRYNNVDDPTSPTYCGIARIFPLSYDTIYMTTGSQSLVRAVLVSNTTVVDTLTRTPFPVYFVDSASVMPLTLAGMNYELDASANIPYPYAAINQSTPAVNDATWDTSFTVDVSNRFYSAPSAVTNTPYVGSLHGLQSYYNRTNEILFGDANVMPMCNLTKLLSIQRSIAATAREALEYPFIYTSNAQNFMVSGQPNLTLVKLLMPYPFGEILNSTGFFVNTTTPAVLATVQFDITMLAAVRNTYASSRVFDQLFPGNTYPFDALTPAQLQQARWLIYDAILKRLAECAQENPYISSGSSSGSSGALVPGCVPRVGITNLTEMALPGQVYSEFNISVFVPETMLYNFSISQCLAGTNWTDVQNYLRTVTAKDRRKCDTGCIVGIAVASAVVAAILVVVVVIITSKRRRLATVVAPAATSEPKFTSTLDMDSHDGSRNPLNG
ncbi:hypothetical protein NESM_000382600 [Novymonas esmeraldas]|uniref:Uncharacterized protein n=1 Tax=Novymonas esmeraldas TaxID=1808958 RepID=A0AAW0EN36_9TRYP